MKIPASFVTVVTGYPRSGTSMMMQILEAGGMPVLHDLAFRPPGEHNPRGFYETKEALSLGKKDSSTGWVADAVGSAVKVIAWQLKHLPADYRYKAIFMRRNAREILESNRKMGLSAAENPLSEKDQVMAYLGEYVIYEAWISRQPHFEALFVSYNEVVADPTIALAPVPAFLGLPLDLPRMISAVDPALHRNR